MHPHPCARDGRIVETITERTPSERVQRRFTVHWLLSARGGAWRRVVGRGGAWRREAARGGVWRHAAAVRGGTCHRVEASGSVPGGSAATLQGGWVAAWQRRHCDSAARHTTQSKHPKTANLPGTQTCASWSATEERKRYTLTSCCRDYNALNDMRPHSSSPTDLISARLTL